MKIVVDSSILIDYLRGGTIENKLFDRIEKENGEFFIPTIVIYELFSGRSSKQTSVSSRIRALIRDFKRIELTEETAQRAGELYRDLGKTLQVQDFIIAASAIEIGGTVLTLNKKHFEQIPHLKIYPI